MRCCKFKENENKKQCPLLGIQKMDLKLLSPLKDIGYNIEDTIKNSKNNSSND